MTNLPGLDGSCPRVASFTHSHANTGASRKMKNEFTLWNQLLGKGTPSTWLSVLRSANRFSVDPACSNTDQNKRGRQEQHATTYRRLRSAGVQSPLANSQPKKITIESSNTTPAASATPQPKSAAPGVAADPDHGEQGHERLRPTR